MKTRPFVVGLVACLAIMVAIGVVIHTLNAGHHRPEGAAERWLAAVSDTTRKGVRADAAKRAEKIGPVALAAPLIPADTNDKGAFPDLEVGKAAIDGTAARVPYRLHQRDVDDPVDGVIVLAKVGDDWHVTALDGRASTERVPSEGGAPPSSAPIGLWVGAVLAGVLVTGGASALVEWATRSSRRALAAT
ncbi:MAG TPA: hypothetical protein VFB78_12335 [Acidimicrobiales bacterium]|nr:hypothetical protein [Acidimicrobiales bacterium]